MTTAPTTISELKSFLARKWVRNFVINECQSTTTKTGTLYHLDYRSVDGNRLNDKEWVESQELALRWFGLTQNEILYMDNGELVSYDSRMHLVSFHPPNVPEPEIEG